MYDYKRTNIVQVLYIYCTYDGVGPLKDWKWGGYEAMVNYGYLVGFQIIE